MDANSSDFYMPKLIGGSIQVDIDLSGAGCSCNAAFYLSKMPGSKFTLGEDYYCDAQPTANNICTEMDLVEANTYAFQATPHTPGDGSGKCWQKGFSTGKYGPGKEIDTTKTFTVKTTFPEDGKSFTTHLKQDGKEVLLNQDCQSYFPGMVNDMSSGMTIVMSNWGTTDMSWLDGDTGCSGSCVGNSVYFSNIVIEQGHYKPQPGGDWNWGDACAHPTD